jgi:hypothetical protein
LPGDLNDDLSHRVDAVGIPSTHEQAYTRVIVCARMASWNTGKQLSPVTQKENGTVNVSSFFFNTTVNGILFLTYRGVSWGAPVSTTR